MSGYLNATICLNGHVVSKFDANSQKYCSECGKETYSCCLKCNWPIRGLQQNISGMYRPTDPYNKPYYCYNCGAAYPWTQRIIDSAVELLSLEDDINDQTKQIIKDAIPTLMTETPDTPIAAAKYKKGTVKVSQFVKDALHSLLVDVVSETAKKIMFT